MRKKKYLILVSFFAFASALIAQDPVFHTLDYANGLPSNTVYNIMQDSRGFIWISHDKGLTRYNGNKFKNYSNNMVQSRALSNLEEDAYGRIWCQNFSGEIFYTQGDSLREFRKFGTTGNFVHFGIYNREKLYTTRSTFLKAFNIKTNQTEAVDTRGIPVVSTNVHATRDAVYCFSYPKKLILKIKDNKLVEQIPFPDKVNPVLFLEIHGGFIILPWTANAKAAVYKKGSWKTIELNIKTLIQNAGIINNQVWISTSEGIYRFTEDLDILEDGKPLFPELNVSRVIQDHEGSIWISTLNRGIYYLSNLNVQLMHLGMPQKAIVSVSYFSSTDRVILGTGDNKLFEFDPYENRAKLVYDFKVRHDITSIYNDVSNDLIWVGSNQMFAIKPGTRGIELEKTFALKDIVFIGGKPYAIAGPDGVSLYSYEGDTADNEYSRLFLNETQPWVNRRQLLKGSEGRSKCVAFDPVSQTLYASNYKGLFYWKPGGKGKVKQKNGDPVYASDILVKGNNIYVVTYDGSLLTIRDNQVIKSVSGFPGLEKKQISKIEAFGENLWLLFENAIVKYNIFTDKYVAFRQTDGLPSTEIKDIIVINNTVYLGTRMGLIRFSESLQNMPVIPRLVIEDIYANKILRIPEDGVYELNSDENNIEINFSLLSFRQNDDVLLYYKINGRDWVSVGTGAGRLNFAGLASGTYKISFKTVKPDGTESVSPETLTVKIASPIWSRWWFILGCIMILGFLTYSFMRFRLTELRKEAEFKTAKERMEKELQMSMLTSIKSQMNPHFVFNALNTVQSYIFTNDKDNAIDYLNKFSDLTRMILDMSNRDIIPLAEEIKALNLYLDLESKRFEDNFNFELKVNDNVNPDMIQIPSMLIQPYVENAIKHGLLHKQTARRLKVEFLCENNALVVFIDDNGIGRKKSQEMKLSKPSGHKSFATEANKKRLQLLNQGRENTIDIEYLDKTDGLGRPDGTMVILAIPFNF